MHAIEDNGTIKFFEGERELTLKEGFARLEQIYPYEPTEGRNIIDNLKRKYMKELIR